MMIFNVSKQQFAIVQHLEPLVSYTTITPSTSPLCSLVSGRTFTFGSLAGRECAATEKKVLLLYFWLKKSRFVPKTCTVVQHAAMRKI